MLYFNFQCLKLDVRNFKILRMRVGSVANPPVTKLPLETSSEPTVNLMNKRPGAFLKEHYVSKNK